MNVYYKYYISGDHYNYIQNIIVKYIYSNYEMTKCHICSASNSLKVNISNESRIFNSNDQCNYYIHTIVDMFDQRSNITEITQT